MTDITTVLAEAGFVALVAVVAIVAIVKLVRDRDER